MREFDELTAPIKTDVPHRPRTSPSPRREVFFHAYSLTQDFSVIPYLQHDGMLCTKRGHFLSRAIQSSRRDLELS